MGISKRVEEFLKEMYGIVEAFVNKEEIGFDDEAKKRNLKAMTMFVDGMQLMADGLDQMDTIIIKGLTESFTKALVSSFTGDSNDMGSLVNLMKNEPNAPLMGHRKDADGQA